jgi:GDP-4-dehydro-6-deoxy-D-mannose reductase
VIIYNGASGGLGGYLRGAIDRTGGPGHALAARLEDQAGLARELAALRPDGDRVTHVHLAARVSVPACESDPAGAHRTNVTLARATVETVLRWAEQAGAVARVIYVSSGHVYAAQPEGTRIAEDAPTAPRSVYARTKLAAEQELADLAAETGAKLLVARVFGLIAPRQAPNYVLPGLIERVRTGRLDGVPGLDFARDYLDSRDVCDDLVLLANAEWDGEALVNVCSGVPVTIRVLLETVLRAVDPATAAERAGQVTGAPGRPDDLRWIVGDPDRFVHLTGEPPQRITLATTVADAVAEQAAS